MHIIVLFFIFRCNWGGVWTDQVSGGWTRSARCLQSEKNKTSLTCFWNAGFGAGTLKTKHTWKLALFSFPLLIRSGIGKLSISDPVGTGDCEAVDKPMPHGVQEEAAVLVTSAAQHGPALPGAWIYQWAGSWRDAALSTGLADSYRRRGQHAASRTLVRRDSKRYLEPNCDWEPAKPPVFPKGRHF